MKQEDSAADPASSSGSDVGEALAVESSSAPNGHHHPPNRDASSNRKGSVESGPSEKGNGSVGLEPSDQTRSNGKVTPPAQPGSQIASDVATAVAAAVSENPTKSGQRQQSQLLSPLKSRTNPSLASTSAPDAAAALTDAAKNVAERKGVPHVYRDFSNVPDAVGVVRKKTGGVAQPFPEKLHNMLNVESESHPHAVSWLPHGRAFIVRDPHEFTDFIMH
ncbi:MAG: hypothetical protein SGILL_007699, partial [Bacillariaceae sp.]